MNMATKPLVPVEEYLRMSFEGPDPEYLDGELLERNLGDDPHSSTQANFIGLFHPLKKNSGFTCDPRSTCDSPQLAFVSRTSRFFLRNPLFEFPRLHPTW